jgi:hypothetical protein
MPRIEAPTLSEHLRSLVESDPEVFVACMDKLYGYILMSSAHVAKEKNALLKLAPSADWGVILEKAYPEMIPVNCFFDNGQFLFFDQEFVSGNYPASYVMFRALNDTYYFSPLPSAVYRSAK